MHIPSVTPPAHRHTSIRTQTASLHPPQKAPKTHPSRLPPSDPRNPSASLTHATYPPTGRKSDVRPCIGSAYGCVRGTSSKQRVPADKRSSRRIGVSFHLNPPSAPPLRQSGCVGAPR
ncbi:hypothetical protein COCCADRAFT_106104 [Bipolaris zeicola 26-R-13]|uniref:Uncharacterized protein n=1 Tax=Cochliobolus carbonum (strain 26-R-13) TaxID=930089 RepID=W6XQB3_COCC2|nr:uncharacterized protein COCCADRAFT_106104 [Bipolaris zeicola 26-R-13]EUC29597.1 hypothetical protein COCCADRAFT_106104 [Bipolaris zeicola 26-R-13]